MRISQYKLSQIRVRKWNKTGKHKLDMMTDLRRYYKKRKVLARTDQIDFYKLYRNSKFIIFLIPFDLLPHPTPE